MDYAENEILATTFFAESVTTKVTNSGLMAGTIPPHLSPFHQDPPARLPSAWTGSSLVSNPNIPRSVRSALSMQQQDAYLLPASPVGGRMASADYRPSVKKALGHVPACLVNASVTYCSNDRIYAFGGFDQYTDEGLPSFAQPPIFLLPLWH